MRHGFLLLDKHEGPTSHDMVSAVRRTLGERDIGHLGTLDPAASGLLVLAVGRKALKVVELFRSLPKEYTAGITFGRVSTTYDREGVIEDVQRKPGWEVPEQAVIQRTIADRFLGRIAQVPPAHSAVHVGGERAYRKARQGRGVALAPRDVEISRCKILSYDFPALTLDVACGSGTYIRSLAHDLGAVLGCGAFLSSLRRTKVGAWSIDAAVTEEDVAWSAVLPLKDVLQSFVGVPLTDAQWEDISHGRDIALDVTPDTIAWHAELPVAILVQAGEGKAHARKVL
ncbi:MAG: tRNA pseudouridine(55) synthase TruB [Candidatus Peregrinibacteria bacterium]|nr:tRNA pseudouridine(55) synthase TruB [Candidatus Peregrinibacteria bacterium]